MPHRITSRTQRAKVVCHQGQVRRLLHRHDVIDPGLALAQGYVAHGTAVAIPCHDMPPQRAPSSAIVERMLALLDAFMAWANNYLAGIINTRTQKA